MSADLRHGRWQDVLADVTCDAFISDPPYSERTHAGNTDLAARVRRTDGFAINDLAYAPMTPAGVAEMVKHWSPRTRGWMACFCDTALIPAYEAAYLASGRMTFAPVPWLQHRPRLGGDGPGSGACYLMVARPREKRFLSWGSLPCWYGPTMAPRTTDPWHHIGGKPLDIMRAIVRDYSRPGDLVCDPYAGGGTTALACLTEGRRTIGAEVDPDTHAKATARLSTWQPSLFVPEIKAEAQDLFGGES